MTYVQDSSPVLLQSAKGLQVRPRGFRFSVAQPKQEFSLDFGPTDLVDRVVTAVAERLKVERSCVGVWFNERLFDDDVMLDVLGVGLTDVMEIRQQDEPMAALLSSLRVSHGQSRFPVSRGSGDAPPPVDEDEVSEAEERAYAAVGLSELSQLREIVKVNKIVRGELEIIEQFLECGKDFNKFRIRLAEKEFF
jgi:hypothetical protein